MSGQCDDFWMYIHELADALDDAGLTRDERLRCVLLQLERMPPLVRRELLRELTQVASDLLDLQPLAMSAVNASEEPAMRPQEAG